MSTAAIHIHNLHKAYRDGLFARPQGAVRGIDLTVEPGETWALLGPNGAGKTTTLHCLMGLLVPDQGTIEICGGSPALPHVRARVGFQSEIFFSYPSFSAAHCLRFYGALSGLQGEDLHARVEAVLQQMGLETAGSKRVGSFSKGMVQRLGLAQSLLHSPDVLIWDEPLSGLDPEGRRLIMDRVLQLRRDGKTVLLSTHVLPDIERVCGHVAIMRAGKILLAGAIAQLCEASGKSLEDLYLTTMAGHGHAS